MPRNLGKAITVAGVLVLLLHNFDVSRRLGLPSQVSSAYSGGPSIWLWSTPGESEKYLEATSRRKGHPIEILVKESEARFRRMVDRQSRSLQDATVEYKRRYERDPPPGFDTWYHLAVERNSTFIDDTYDVIMKDLAPFRKLSVRDLKQRLQAVVDSDSWIVPFEIKDHRLLAFEKNWRSDHFGSWVEPYVQYLPDLQIPYDILPEPRIAVPSEELLQDKSGCQIPVDAPQDTFKFLDLKHKRPWGHAIGPCSPSSPARANKAELSGLEDSMPSVDNSSAAINSDVAPENLRFVSNAAAIKDICENPEVETQYGLLISPDTLRLSKSLLPVFSRDKPSSFQDILVPTPVYANRDDEGEMSWNNKKNDLYWVGTTSGGYHHNGSWRFSQRFRFVSLMNDALRPITLLRQVKAQVWEKYQSTVDQISHLIDVKFTSQKLCDEADCATQRMDSTIRFGGQDDGNAFKRHKLVIDVDGQASTDRFYKLMSSKSAVLKQTLCLEWHDERLTPWVHYVPVSAHMEELPEIIRFLTEEKTGRDIARSVADQGRAFAKRNLRDDDMGLFVFRLLLEWARVIDPKRDEGLPVCESRG